MSPKHPHVDTVGGVTPREKATAKLTAEWFWIDRWTGSSAFLLSLEARGLYREMLSQAWRRGARLPNNHEAIRRAIGATLEEWERTWPLVERYWRVDGDDLVNDTQLEVYGEALSRQQKQTERARMGGYARWGRRPGNAQASAQAEPKRVPEQCTPSPSLSPSQTHVQEHAASPQESALNEGKPRKDSIPSRLLLQKLAHQVIADNPAAEFADMKEDLKAACAKAVPGFYEATVVGEVLESALRRRGQG